MQMSAKSIFTCVMLTLTLANCASYDFSRKIVQQGNLLQQPVVDRLKIGMSKDDTATLLGNSLLSPTFDNDRWDYAYTYRKGNSPMEVRNLSLYFKHGSLVHIEHKP